MSPKGDKEIRALSVYVQAMAYLPNAVVSSTYAKLKLRLLNQKNSIDVEKRGTNHNLFITKLVDFVHHYRLIQTLFLFVMFFLYSF